MWLNVPEKYWKRCLVLTEFLVRLLIRHIRKNVLSITCKLHIHMLKSGWNQIIK